MPGIVLYLLVLLFKKWLILFFSFNFHFLKKLMLHVCAVFKRERKASFSSS